MLLLTLSIFIYLFSLQNTHGYFYTRLKTRATIALALATQPQEAGTTDQQIRDRYLPALPDEKEYVLTYDSVKRDWNRNATPALPDVFFKELTLSGTAEYEDDFVYYSGAWNAEHRNMAVIAVAYNEEGEDQIYSLQRVLVAGFAVSCVIVFALGRLFARRVIKPVADVTREANEIRAANLHRRLAMRGEDEIADLVLTFNGMLDRLQTAFELQSNFISNASHELRTPLTVILGESDVILSGSRSEQEYKRSIDLMRHEAQRLNDLVEGLLKLSQVGFDGKKQMLEEVSIDILLMNIKSHLNMRIPDNKVRIEIKDVPEDSDGLVFSCIAVWIELALLNIINNAIKYSNNREVLVTLSATDTELDIRIFDSGIGIPQTDIQHVFELFFRGSNSMNYTGHGIGLPLADKIIRLHGGSIHIESEFEKGTCVGVTFRKSLMRK